MTAETAWSYPYAGDDHKLHCPYDRAQLRLAGDGMWYCDGGGHKWHRFGFHGFWRLMRGTPS